MHRLPLRLVALSCLLAAWLAAPPPAGAAGERPFDVRSAYLGDPLLGGHRVRLEGFVGGIPGAGAILELDPNRCQLDEFGDVTTCTRMAPRRIEVKLSQVKIGDPSGMGRQLFVVQGLPTEPAHSPGPRLFLVVPPQGSGDSWRLVLDAGEAGRRVVTLESHPPAPQGGAPRPPAAEGGPSCSNAAYAGSQAGDQVTLVAEVEAPTPGYRIRFERLRVRGHAAQFRLICEPPAGLVPQVITHERVTTTFTWSGPLEFVTVHDNDGAHRVTIDQRR